MRALLFKLLFYPSVAMTGILALPMLLWPSPKPVSRLCQVLSAWVLFLLRWIVGVTVEWRGFDTLPKDRAYIYLAKHMSYLDVFATYWRLPDLTALAKRELFLIPLVGQVLGKLNIVAIDRGKGTAREQMPKVVGEVVAQNKPLLVYPEATRTRPDERRPLKSGAFYLQQDGRLDVFPIATNSGMHWGKGLLDMKPGKVVLEVGAPFPHGIDKEQFMALVIDRVIAPSDRLMQALDGHTPPPLPSAKAAADRANKADKVA
ncbi:MAG: lysophospholipid acyltransferase family protein [Rhodothalassiaceae bacterium]